MAQVVDADGKLWLAASQSSPKRIRSRIERTRTAARELATFVNRSGSVRRKKDADASEGDRKGDELRIVGRTRKEAARIAELVNALGYKAGRPWRKATGYVVPIYGRAVVPQLLRQLERTSGRR